MAGKQGTKKVDIRLACGRIETGGTSVAGEVMNAPGAKLEPSVVRWIVPDGRLTDELGIRIIKEAGKVTLDKGPLEKPLQCMIINGLPYLSWDDFVPIRLWLMRSHKAGRPMPHLSDGKNPKGRQTLD